VRRKLARMIGAADTTASRPSGLGAVSVWCRRWWPVPAILIGALVLRLVVIEPFLIPSASMEPTLEPGDRILVNKLAAHPVHRGDVVVFDGATTFGMIPASGSAEQTVVSDLLRGGGDSSTYVKRVLGVGGDHVVCCTLGRITINGAPVDEPYLYPGDAPSRVRFDVTVPAGRLWFMGDHRAASADSRAHLAAPGGGTVAEVDVVGTVAFRIWPLDRFGPVQEASVQVGAASTPTSTGRR
jgi:signal peptidase I